MAYCTVQQVRDASGLTNSTNVPDAYITLKIGYADGLINGKIGEVYSLPLASTPNLIAAMSLEIAVALLFLDQYGEEAENTDKGWQKRLDFLVKQLEDIRLQKIKLYDDTTGTELTRTTLKNPAFLPNDTTSDPEYTDPTNPKITMNRVW